MTNIAITSQCNRSCRYCFAQAASADTIGAAVHMSRATFVKALDFVDRSQVDPIRLLGGEPTLHPEFVAFLTLALERGKPIRIFSNGSMPEAALRCVENLPVEAVSFTINLTASLGDTGIGHETVLHTLRRLGSRAMLGINVFRPSRGLGLSGRGAGLSGGADVIEDLLELFDRYRLTRDIRIGLAHPCVDFENAYLSPKEYAAVGQGIVELAERAAQRSVRLTLDCGFVPCVMPGLLDGRFAEIARQVRGHCGAVLDILPDGRVIPCYSLARLCSEPLDDDESAATLRARFDRRLAPFRKLGIFQRCADCRFRRQRICSGGCVGAALRRLRTPDFELAFGTTDWAGKDLAESG